MPAGGALIDAFRQIAHLRHARRDFLAQKHAAAARLGTLPHHYLDGIRLAQIFEVHAVARGQILIDQRLAMAAFFRRHAAIAGGGGSAHRRCTPAQSFFGLAGKCAKTHAGDRHRNFQMNRLAGEPGSKRYIRSATFPVAFQRVAGNGSTQEQQIIEMRQLALRPAAADVVNTGRGGALNLGDREFIESRGTPRRRAGNMGTGGIIHG